MGDRGDCAFLLCLLRLFETDGPPEEAQMEVKFLFLMQNLAYSPKDVARGSGKRHKYFILCDMLEARLRF